MHCHVLHTLIFASLSFSPSGEDGPSQMALEDFAMFRSIPGAACFYPSDAVSCERAIELAANYQGVTFTRTSRPATAVIYNNDEKFEIGKGKVRDVDHHTIGLPPPQYCSMIIHLEETVIMTGLYSCNIACLFAFNNDRHILYLLFSSALRYVQWCAV